MTTPERRRRLLEVLEKRQPDLTVVLERLRNPHNISAILRSCDAVGIQYVHIVEESGVIALSRGVSRGSAQWLDISFYDDLLKCFQNLKDQGFKIYVTSVNPRARDFREVDYTCPCAVVVGKELEGVSQEALEEADECIVIPMVGFVQSFNVSVATAIVLYEAYRQRERAGMYSRARLATEEKERILARWLML
ncbi:tRNA (guanine-N2)-dimethyltransferase [Thermoplasmatales archaeon ex4484_36]|nr:MAG: tRNA (guanine-N2)-dimethyltransferase [Thermoplasmatales archaeon ex4484_36]